VLKISFKRTQQFSHGALPTFIWLSLPDSPLSGCSGKSSVLAFSELTSVEFGSGFVDIVLPKFVEV
jgi:hypothetical protein